MKGDCWVVNRKVEYEWQWFNWERECKIMVPVLLFRDLAVLESVRIIYRNRAAKKIVDSIDAQSD